MAEDTGGSTRGLCAATPYQQVDQVAQHAGDGIHQVYGM